MSSIRYEHVIISAPLESDQSSSTPGVTITFNRPDCRQPDPSQYHEA
jgi:hypothetical protein